MCKKDIDDVLLINWNLVIDQLKNPNCESITVARDYLTKKIGDLLHRYNDNGVIDTIK